MRSFIIAVALVALFPLTTSAQSFEGAWQRVSATFEGGGNSRTSTQPSLILVTAGHFAGVEINTDEPRPLFERSTSDAERLAAFQGTISGAGTWEMNGSTVTLHTTAAMNPNLMAEGSLLTFEVSFEGNDSMTSVFTFPNGSTITRRYVRVD